MTQFAPTAPAQVTPGSFRHDMALGLQQLVGGLADPATGSPLFAAVQVGAFFAPQNYASWCEVAFSQGKSGPKGAGGYQIGWRIEDEVTFLLTSGWDYQADASLAMLAMLHAQDVLLPLLHSHVVIPSPQNPGVGIATVWGVWEEQPDRSVPVRLPVGRVYLLWHVFIVVRQQYSIIIQNP